MGWSLLAAKLVLALWSSSENQLETAVLSQLNHVFVVKHNKLFKRDSQRVAFLLCVGFSVLGGMRRLRYCVAHPLTGRYA
ncbi:DUF3265 domain-containing protein [Vibrio parahaemolyticus]|nr:DUF3265 domain-containing protein [Vibrio parahaemolyticus]